MDTTILQVPLKKTLRDRAFKAATEAGFSSLQEAVRVFLANLSDKVVKISFEHPPVKLSAKAAKRYDRMSKEMDAGKGIAKTFKASDSIDDIMDWLNS
ncbi:MAG: hypothetical protein AAB874_00105 [Patescibacteria group bacterium]